MTMKRRNKVNDPLVRCTTRTTTIRVLWWLLLWWWLVVNNTNNEYCTQYMFTTQKVSALFLSLSLSLSLSGVNGLFFCCRCTELVRGRFWFWMSSSICWVGVVILPYFYTIHRTNYPTSSGINNYNSVFIF